MHSGVNVQVFPPRSSSLFPLFHPLFLIKSLFPLLPFPHQIFRFFLLIPFNSILLQISSPYFSSPSSLSPFYLLFISYSPFLSPFYLTFPPLHLFLIPSYPPISSTILLPLFHIPPCHIYPHLSSRHFLTPHDFSFPFSLFLNEHH